MPKTNGIGFFFDQTVILFEYSLTLPCCKALFQDVPDCRMEENMRFSLVVSAISLAVYDEAEM